MSGVGGYLRTMDGLDTFSQASSEQFGERLTNRRWRRICTAARDAADYDGTTHDLRHFTASALISGGASV
jgi:integrase